MTIWLLDPEGYVRMYHGRKAWWPELEAKNIVLELQAESRVKELGMPFDFETSNPAPTDMLPTTRSHTTSKIRQFYQMQTKYSNICVMKYIHIQTITS